MVGISVIGVGADFDCCTAASIAINVPSVCDTISDVPLNTDSASVVSASLLGDLGSVSVPFSTGYSKANTHPTMPALETNSANHCK